MEESAKEKLDEWLADMSITNANPVDREDAEVYRGNLVSELEEEGVSELALEQAAGGDLTGYILRVLGKPGVSETFSVEHGHLVGGEWQSAYPPMTFQAVSMREAKKYVDAKLVEGAFEAWKGGSVLRLWSISEAAFCKFKDDFSADWT